MMVTTEHYTQTSSADIRMINFHNATGDYQIHLPAKFAGKTGLELMTVSIVREEDGGESLDYYEYIQDGADIYHILGQTGYGPATVKQSH